MTEPTFTSADDALLLGLLEIPTVSPLESSALPRIREAQEEYARAAAHIGLDVVHHGPAGVDVLDGIDVPLAVREAAARSPEMFLAAQPNLVLRLGMPRSTRERLMFNVHLDTVGGLEPIGFDGARFTGRGAIDAKGPAVALLAGLRAALDAEPDLTDDIEILVQAVPGEEGGCMGVFGTRTLVEAGYTGSLNVFCEPTEHALLRRSSATMTARILVEGDDAIDDMPGEGHNATVLVARIVDALAKELLPRAHALGARTCIAGVHTGTMHNKVYGTGSALLNIAYDSSSAGAELEIVVETLFARALEAAATEYASIPGLERTAREAHRVMRLEWVKRGLPVLSNQPADGDRVLQRLGLPEFAGCFTCDAIWMSGKPGYTVVYGPGSLAKNNAHAPGEFADRHDLARYAQGISALVREFRADVRAM